MTLTRSMLGSVYGVSGWLLRLHYIRPTSSPERSRERVWFADEDEARAVRYAVTAGASLEEALEQIRPQTAQLL